MEDCIFSKITIQGENQIRLYVKSSENQVEIIVLQNGKAWESIVNISKLKVFASLHKLNIEAYKSRLLDYCNAESPDALFNLSNDEFTITIKPLKVKFLQVTLAETNYVDKTQLLLDKFYTESVENAHKLALVKGEKEKINENKKLCEDKLQQLIVQKQIDEDEQMGRFVLILNEKKLRIQHLTELIEAFRNGRPSTNPPVPGKNKSQKRKVVPKKEETISESETSESVSTDEEMSYEKPPENVQITDFLQDDDVKSNLYILPKRLKSDNIKTDVSFIEQASTSKLPENVSSDEEVTREEPPTVTLNTQQLLDML